MAFKIRHWDCDEEVDTIYEFSGNDPSSIPNDLVIKLISINYDSNIVSVDWSSAKGDIGKDYSHQEIDTAIFNYKIRRLSFKTNGSTEGVERFSTLRNSTKNISSLGSRMLFYFLKGMTLRKFLRSIQSVDRSNSRKTLTH